MAVLYAMDVETPTRKLVMVVSGISFGTMIAVASETQFDLFGFVIHEISAVAEASRVVLTQKLLADHNFAPLEGLCVPARARRP